jgi:uncharacterized protein (DUF302 family)
MPIETSAYGLRVRVTAPFEEAVSRITEKLAEQGFGVLTEIDVRATLQRKIGAEFRRYVILGACNPHLAHRALASELEVGLLLPCNVIVYEEEAGACVVAAVDPDAMLGVVGSDALADVAAEAGRRLRGALEAVAA